MPSSNKLFSLDLAVSVIVIEVMKRGLLGLKLGSDYGPGSIFTLQMVRSVPELPLSESISS